MMQVYSEQSVYDVSRVNRVCMMRVYDEQRVYDVSVQ